MIPRCGCRSHSGGHSGEFDSDFLKAIVYALKEKSLKKLIYVPNMSKNY
jgi:hypothetical protein